MSRLETDYSMVNTRSACGHIVFTGPIDEFFDYRFGKLPYRSLRFEHEHVPGLGQLQETSTVNYPNGYSFTRITEFRHLTGQRHSGTSIVRELPQADGNPYYPIPTKGNEEHHARYAELARQTPRSYLRGPIGRVSLLQHGSGCWRSVGCCRSCSANVLITKSAPDKSSSDNVGLRQISSRRSVCW